MRNRMPTPIVPGTPFDFRWDDLRLFLAAYRARSLTAAAKALGLNQSTLSRRLASFEEGLGVPLFERTREGLVATAAADEILPAAELAEEASLDVARRVAPHVREVSGEVRVALTGGIGRLFAPLLAGLRRDHPGLVVTLLVSTSFADLTRREADIAIRFQRPERGDLVSQRIARLHYRIFASEELARALGPGPHAVQELPWIAWDHQTQLHFPETRWERSLGVRPAAHATDVLVRIEMALGGVGVIALPYAGPTPVEGLVPIEVTGANLDAHTVSVWLVTHAALRRVPRVAAVWDRIIGGLDEMVPAAGATTPGV